MWKAEFVFAVGISAHFSMDAHFQAVHSQIQHDNAAHISFPCFSTPNTYQGLARRELFACFVYACE